VGLWDELVGQDVAVATLSHAATEAVRAAAGQPVPSFSQAYLITGPPGSGRSVAGLAFAAALVCPEAGCGHCAQCDAALRGTHPDVERVAPTGLSYGVADTRELVMRAATAPLRGSWHVVVVEDADRLTEQATNALLKAIEEPADRTVWVLCAPSTEDVLPTIRSRCRHVALRTPPNEAVAHLLVTRDGVDPALAAFAARASMGHIGRARALAQDETARMRRHEVLRVATSLDSLPVAFMAAAGVVEAATDDARTETDARDVEEKDEMMTAFGAGAEGKGVRQSVQRGASTAIKDLEQRQKARRTRTVRDRLDMALVDLLSFYRDVLILQFGASGELVHAEMRPILEETAASSTPVQTRRRMEAIVRARESLEAAGAPQLVLESLAVELSRA
jgi:DNA polymerase III subunit delta'